MNTDTLYKESYARQTPYYHEELPATRDGEAGVIPSYSTSCDTYVAIGFLICIVVSLLSIAKSRRFINFQMKYLFRMPRENSFEMRETLSEVQYQVYFIVQGVLMYTLLAYEIATEYVAQEYRVSDYMLMGIFGATIALFFVLKKILLSITLPVFFSKSQRHMASISRTFLLAVQGAIMLPTMLLNVYYKLSTETTIYIAAIGLSLTTLLQFYKTYCIFFRKNYRLLQFFLYLCTLKAIPFALLIGILYFTAHYFKVNI